VSEPAPPAPVPHRPNIRLSLAWFGVAALVFLVDGATLIRPPSPPVAPGPGYYATYYIVDHRSFSLSLAAGFGLFGALYLGMTPRFPIRLRPALGWAHLAIMSIGVSLVEAPRLVLSWTGVPKSDDLSEAFTTWNRTASIGYVMLLIGLGLFFVALIDGFSRRRRPRGTP